MVNELLVYDGFLNNFRRLNKENYDDDLVCGCVLLERNAIIEISKYYCVCGYVLIEKITKCFFPIDIQEDKVVIFEGTYNQMPTSLKDALVNYNIKVLTGKLWSSFFIKWQFLLDDDVFEKSNPFIELCNNIIDSPMRRNRLLDMNEIVLYEPINYEELCKFTKNILKLSDLNINEYDYTLSVKYLIDSLIKGYRINFSKNDIKEYFFNICMLVDERWNM
ncbi:MAG: hypothetical protein IJ359_02645 [Erysipelotrichaceae bacterium]|nr:hypothetical protein [Erysipelotrichaceae bacterium]